MPTRPLWGILSGVGSSEYLRAGPAPPGLGTLTCKMTQAGAQPQRVQGDRCWGKIFFPFALENFKYIPKSREGAFSRRGCHSKVAQTAQLR